MTGKTASLVLFSLFILVSPIFAEPLPDEDFFFFEEFFIYDELFTGDELLLGEESVPEEEELFPDEEDTLSDEFFDDDDIFPDDGAFAFEAPTLILEVPVFETRSINQLFPNFSRVQKVRAMSETGLRYYFQSDGSPSLIPDPASGIDILSIVMGKNPSHIIEALAVVPYSGREYDMLDIYNALGRIENIKDYTVPLNGKDFSVFLETTRIQNARNRRSIPDPPPSNNLPFSETMYLSFKDAYMGNLYIRGDVSVSIYGITYSMTNFADVRYFLLPVMKAERFSAVIYLEPLVEGILIYCMSGFYLPGFIAERVNLTPNINRRITVFINWITDGLKRSAVLERE